MELDREHRAWHLYARATRAAKAREPAMIVKSIVDAKGRDVVTIEPGASLDTAAKLLAKRRIGAVVVLGADDRVVGILSERDIVRVISERGAGGMQEQVAQVMTRKVATCTFDETIHSIMERMTTGKFRHVPVIEQGRLAGIVSIGDVVKHRIVEMEQESAALRDYIQTA
jgi:CBS domain-containing protein